MPIVDKDLLEKATKNDDTIVWADIISKKEEPSVYSGHSGTKMAKKRQISKKEAFSVNYGNPYVAKEPEMPKIGAEWRDRPRLKVKPYNSPEELDLPTPTLGRLDPNSAFRHSKVKKELSKKQPSKTAVAAYLDKKYGTVVPEKEPIPDDDDEDLVWLTD